MQPPSVFKVTIYVTGMVKDVSFVSDSLILTEPEDEPSVIPTIVALVQVTVVPVILVVGVY